MTSYSPCFFPFTADEHGVLQTAYLYPQGSLHLQLRTLQRAWNFWSAISWTSAYFIQILFRTG